MTSNTIGNPIKVQRMMPIFMLAANLASACSFISKPFVGRVIEATWGNLRFLQWAAAVSTLILTVGALIEYWEIIWRVVLLTVKWLLARSTPFDRCTLRKLLLHSLGPILVTAGIAGELLFESRAFIVEDQDTAELVGEVNEAKGSANTAAADAKIAHGEADATKTIADGAKTTADQASVRASEAELSAKRANVVAAKAESELAVSLERTSRLEAQLSWRTVTPEQHKKIIDSLSAQLGGLILPLRGVKVVFEVTIGDEEAKEYAIELAGTLHRALEGTGATLDVRPSVILTEGRASSGIIVSINDKAIIQRTNAGYIRRALDSAGIPTYMLGDPQIAEDTISIFVALKPQPNE